MAAVEVGGLIALVLIGLVVIVLVKAFLFLLPAGVVAFIVWLITANSLFAGIGFLAVALVSLVKR